MVSFRQQRLISKSLLSAVHAGNLSAVAKQLDSLSLDGKEYNAPFMRANAEALRSNRWADVAHAFIQGDFVSENRTGLIIAPYTVRRGGRDVTEMSVIHFRVLDHDPVPRIMDDEVRSLFGEPRQKYPRILPVQVINAGGAFGNQGQSEAFIVPDGWEFPEGERGPALNDMVEQTARFRRAGVRRIRTIFDPATADLLLSTYATPDAQMQVQTMEYALHDVGHGTGIGLREKIAKNLLQNGWHRGVEEHRADGVALQLAANTFITERAAALVASNMLIRFGVDAHRQGGVADTDINCCLLSFETLIESGGLEIADGGKLKLSDPSPQGLLRATEQLRVNAVALTRKELRLTNSAELVSLYGGIALSDSTRLLFQATIVNPCRGIRDNLR